MRRLYPALFCFLLSYSVQSQDFHYINVTEYIAPGSDPDNFIGLNGNLIFAADDHYSSGRELWKSNGIWGGTVLLKDINPGESPGNPAGFVVSDGIAYFSATNGINGVELWRTDGTTAGTYMVRDINTGASSSNPSDLKSYDGVVFFRAETPTRGKELWRTDGTSAGTVLVKDIYPGTSSGNPSWFAVMAGVLYFSAHDPDHGTELWKTDGTTAGTVLVRDISPGTANSSPAYTEKIKTTLFFRAVHPVEGWTLMKSDGTSSGTVPVKPGSGIHVKQRFESVGFIIYFVSDQDELWKSDGTPAGTVKIKEITPGALTTTLRELTSSGGQLFFVSNDGTHGHELWKSDGTTAGTVMVADLRPGAIGSNPSNLKSIRGILYFAADAEWNGYNRGNELWKTDGTSGGTEFVHDFNFSYRDGNPDNLILVRDKLFISAIEVDYGNELWVADLSEPDAKMSFVKEEKPVERSSLQFYPNPSIKTAILRIQTVKAEHLSCIIIDMHGKTVQQKSIAVNEGNNTIAVEIASLAAGTYTLVVKGANFDEQVKFIKQ